MKKLILSLGIMCAFFCTATAQSTVVSAAATAQPEQEVIQWWKKMMDIFNSDANADFKNFYTADACEITPEGKVTQGRDALLADWTAFMRMLDKNPTFSSANENIRFITPDIAIVTWDGDASFVIKGQQVGGKTKGLGVIHKVNGQWLIEADAIVPIMPPMPETAKHE